MHVSKQWVQYNVHPLCASGWNILSSASPSGDRFGEHTPRKTPNRLCPPARALKKEGGRKRKNREAQTCDCGWVVLRRSEAPSTNTDSFVLDSVLPTSSWYLLSKVREEEAPVWPLLRPRQKPHSQTQTKTSPIISYNGPWNDYRNICGEERYFVHREVYPLSFLSPTEHRLGQHTLHPDNNTRRWCPPARPFAISWCRYVSFKTYFLGPPHEKVALHQLYSIKSPHVVLLQIKHKAIR